MNSQCISIGFVGGTARPPPLSQPHTHFFAWIVHLFSLKGDGDVENVFPRELDVFKAEARS